MGCGHRRNRGCATAASLVAMSQVLGSQILEVTRRMGELAGAGEWEESAELALHATDRHRPCAKSNHELAGPDRTNEGNPFQGGTSSPLQWPMMFG